MPTMKTCSRCGEEKDLEDFNKKLSANDGRRANCRACQRAEGKLYRQMKIQQDPNYVRTKHLKTKYKLTFAEAEALLASRGYRCEACGVHKDDTFNKALAFDHDHACCPGEITCGRCIRGVLCIPCNVAFGALRDSLVRVEQLAVYAKKVTNATS